MNENIERYGDRIILALDKFPLDRALDLVGKVGFFVYASKMHDLADKHGIGVAATLRKAGARRAWFDGKLHDIPETVKNRAIEIHGHGADVVSVHAEGGIEMMMAALESKIQVYAITVLTSLDEDEIHLMTGQPSRAAVLYRARLAKLAGVHGVVCSAKEVGLLAKRPELKGLEFVVPGTRSAGKEAHDQRRTDTPAAAIKAGATRLVIGRQVTKASDPVAALEEICEEIAGAVAEMEASVAA